MMVDSAPMPMAARVLSIAEWVVSAGLVETRPDELIAGLRERLNQSGFAVGRLQVAFRILHPLFSSMTITSDDDSATVAQLQVENRQPDSDFSRSPFAALLAAKQEHMRHRLDSPEAIARFPIFEVLADRGFTDYSAHAVPFGERAVASETQNGVVISFATRRPGGFADDEVEALKWLSVPLGLALKVHISQQITWNTLRTFHGSAVGERILGGMIKRGSGERLHTVVWYSDLRRSTALGESLALDSFLALLNAYFDCTAGAILAHGGQVLELIGDAVLGIFPVEAGGSEEAACRAALAAARDARRRLESLAETRADLARAIDFGIGLHIGEVIFGNVGTQDRLSFGLVGSIVSETARMESLTKTVGRPVVVSDRIAEAASMPLDDIGHHLLRGVEARRHLWALPREG